MKKLLALSIFLATSYLLLTTNSYAQYGPYGGPSPSLSIVVNKLVGVPTITKGGLVICDNSISFVNNFSPSDPRFHAGDFVCFQVKVKNTSNTTLSGVTVVDNIPSDVEPIEPPGTFDSKARTITFSAGDFAQNEEKSYFLLMQVHPQNQLPADKGLFCEVNKAQASNNNVSDNSTSQFCIEKQVANVPTTPSAGPEMGMMLVVGELITLGFGLMIKKLAIRNR